MNGSGKAMHAASSLRSIISAVLLFCIGFAMGMLAGTTQTLTPSDIFSSRSLGDDPPGTPDEIMPPSTSLSSTQDDSGAKSLSSSEVNSYQPTYAIIGIRVESRKDLPASSIPGSSWLDVPVPKSNATREERQAIQRTHMVAALEHFLPSICINGNEWFLWLEDDVFIFDGSLLRVGGIILAIKERYKHVGQPAFVRLGVGLTAALLRCHEAKTALLDELKTVERPVDEIVGSLFHDNGKTLNYETALFGHMDGKGGAVSVIQTGEDQNHSAREVKIRSENRKGKLLLTTNLARPSFAFDSTGCLGYAWSPCPSKGDRWAPTSSFDWWGDRRESQGEHVPVVNGVGHTEPNYSAGRWTVVHSRDTIPMEDCKKACRRYGTVCEESGMAEINNPLTFRERSGLSCDEIFSRGGTQQLPAFAILPKSRGYTLKDVAMMARGNKDTEKEKEEEVATKTQCYLNYAKPTCKGEGPQGYHVQRICTCTPISITEYDSRALESWKKTAANQDQKQVASNHTDKLLQSINTSTSRGTRTQGKLIG